MDGKAIEVQHNLSPYAFEFLIGQWRMIYTIIAMPEAGYSSDIVCEVVNQLSNIVCPREGEPIYIPPSSDTDSVFQKDVASTLAHLQETGSFLITGTKFEVDAAARARGGIRILTLLMCLPGLGFPVEIVRECVHNVNAFAANQSVRLKKMLDPASCTPLQRRILVLLSEEELKFSFTEIPTATTLDKDAKCVIS